ncbi:MAG: hypothetical protein WDN28_09630 [Chthoniobacter sp.]
MRESSIRTELPALQAGDALAFINGVTDPHDPHYGKAITGADYGEIVVGGLVSDTTSAQHGLYSTNAPTFTALSRGGRRKQGRLCGRPQGVRGGGAGVRRIEADLGRWPERGAF